MKDEYEVIIYQTDDGKEPFTDWLEALKDSEWGRACITAYRVNDCKFLNCYKL